MQPTPTRILVAEDDGVMRELLGEVLRDKGFEVVLASESIEALEQLRHTLTETPPMGFDLVISDLRMPGLSGLDLLAGLRHTSCASPFILITAFGSAEDHEEARRLGAAAVLDKPFDFDHLLSAVREAT